jgi:hypothetical protein
LKEKPTGTIRYQMMRCFSTNNGEGKALYPPHIILAYHDDAQQAYDYQRPRLILSNLTRIVFRYPYRLVHRNGIPIQHWSPFRSLIRYHRKNHQGETMLMHQPDRRGRASVAGNAT